jgi:hypothetical protein
VIEFWKVKVLAAVPVKVYVPVVKVLPLIVVAVAAPKVGVTSVGLVLNTKFVEVVPVVPVAAFK